MISNYKKIGDYIQQVNKRNTDGAINLLLGVNLDKKFIPSVANINGTDLTKYKVVKRGQFGCKLMSVGRDQKLPISRLTEHKEAIISSAYFVFEVVDESELLPEYLMMWFSRGESDRYLWFQSGGDVRGRITWEDLCNLPIKVPSIKKQQEIVNEYNTVVNRIKLNEQLNLKLEETALALYKHWFVDFEFPNEDGNPYKSSGGKMVYNEELDNNIPEGWEVKKLDDVSLRITDGSHTSPPSVDKGIPMSSVKDMTNWGLNLESSRKISYNDYERLVKSDCKPLKNDILIAKDGSFLKYIFVNNVESDVVILSSIAIIRPNDLLNSNQLSLYLKMENTNNLMRNVVSGGAIQRIILKEFKKIPVIVPPRSIQIKASKFIDPLLSKCWLNYQENIIGNRLKKLLLSKMSKI